MTGVDGGQIKRRQKHLSDTSLTRQDDVLISENVKILQAPFSGQFHGNWSAYQACQLEAPEISRKTCRTLAEEESNQVPEVSDGLLYYLRTLARMEVVQQAFKLIACHDCVVK